MSEQTSSAGPAWDDATWQLLQQAIDRLEQAWRAGPTPRLAEFLPVAADDPRRLDMLARLIEVDRQCRGRVGLPHAMDDYLAQWPQLRERSDLQQRLGGASWQVDSSLRAGRQLPPAASGFGSEVRGAAPLQPWALKILCPHCRRAVEVLDEDPMAAVNCPACSSSFRLVDGGAPVESAAGGPARIRRRVAHFELIEQLGMGAFGSVWRAKDTQLDAVVAVKVPRVGQLEPDVAERFVREARAAAQLHHPNIVRVHAIGRDGDQLYIVSDLIDGVTLDEWRSSHPISFQEAARLCAKIAEAMHYAHERGVVHRDLKPQNILIDDGGEPHLTDFGLAKREAGEMTMTVQGQLLGSPAYLSPEQAAGRAHEADRRSDVYSLGVILFELLTGERPFRGAWQMLLKQHEEDEAPSLRKLDGRIPRDLETICLACLEKAPARRYATGQALAEELGRHLRNEPILRRPLGRPERFWRWCKRKPAVAALAAALSVAIVGGLIGVTLQWIRAEQYAADVVDEKERTERTAAAEKHARLAAQAAHQQARRNLYVANMRELQAAWDHGDAVRMRELLNRYLPETGQNDLRTFPWYYWWRLCHGYSMNLDCQRSVLSIAFSPDGARLVTGGQNQLRLWAVASGETVKSIPVKCYPHSVAFAPDGKTVAYGGTNGTAGVADVATGQSHGLLEGPAGYVESVAFSPDGRTLATSGTDRKIRLWDVAAKKLLSTLEGHEDTVSALAFSPNGKLLASGSFDDSVRLWDTAHGEHLKSLQSNYVFCVAFSPDGKTLASGNTDGSVTLWNVEIRSRFRTLQGKLNDLCYAVAFSPDGRTIASGGNGNTIELWDLNRVRRKPSAVLKGHGGWVRSLSYSPNGEFLASASADGTAKLWPVRSIDAAAPYQDIAKERTPAPRLLCSALSPDGKWLATACDQTILVWDFPAGQLKHTLSGHTDDITSLGFSEDARRLASGSKDNTARLWDLTKTPPTSQTASPGFRVSVVAICSRRSLLAIGGGTYDATARSWGHVLKLWDMATGQEKASLDGRFGPVLAAVFTADGKSLAAAQGAGVMLWSIPELKLQRTLRGDKGAIRGVAFTRNGDLLASYGDGGALQLWDPANASRLSSIRGAAGQVLAACFSPDGRTLASGGVDGIVRLWDTATSEPIAEFPVANDEGRRGNVNHLFFSADGSRLLSNDWYYLRSWRAATEADVRRTAPPAAAPPP